MNKLEFIIRNKYNTGREALKTIYTGAIEPAILYGSEIWGGKLTIKQRKKIDAVQRKAAIKTIKAYNTVSTEASITLADMRRTVYKANERWTENQIKKGNGQKILDELTNETGATMEKKIATLEHPAKKVIITYETENMRAETELQKTTIYTDGSKTKKGTGYAFAVFQKGEERATKTIKCNDAASVFQCELSAIKEAAEYIAQQNEDNTQYEIVTDSRSALEALKNRKRNTCLIQETVNVIKKIKTKTKWRWTRAHIGTDGNERADELAKQSTEKNDIEKRLPIPTKTIRHKLRQRTIANEKIWYENAINGQATRNFFPTHEAARRPKDISGKLIQIITGHGNFKTYIKERLKKLDNDLCECGTAPQNVEHLLFVCKREEAARALAERKMGTTWPQDWTALREWVTEDETATTALNIFANNLEAFKEQQ